MTDPVFFVSGAGGNLGRRVIELLLERGQAGRIVGGTRTPATITGLVGVEARRSSYDDIDELVRALDGVDRFLMTSSSPVGEARMVQHLNAVAAAKQAGVGHIVYTSMINPTLDSPIPFASEHRRTEEAIAASGIAHTILRVVWYADGLVGQLAEAIKHGEWLSAAGEGRIAHARREDCARAATGALLNATDTSRVLDVTGPIALTTREIVVIGGRIAGKPIAVVDLSETDMKARLLTAGLPETVIDTFVIPFERNTREGRIDVVTDAVAKLWGTPAQGLEAFLGEHKAKLG